MVIVQALRLNFLILILSVSLAHAYVGDDFGSSINYCNPSYREVKTIYLSYESGLQENKPIDWNKTLKLINDRYQDILSKEHIEFVITDLPEDEALKGSTNALYVKLFYSYVSKDDFNPTVPENVLAVWSEHTRILDDKGLELALAIDNQSSLPFRSNPTENPVRRQSGMWLDSFLPDEDLEFSPIDLSVTSSFVLDGVVCGVLFSSAGKKCMDHKHFSKQTIVAAHKRCVDEVQSDGQ